MKPEIKTFEEYFNEWDDENLAKIDLSRDISREDIYKNYVIKKKVLFRDVYVCQNELCETPDSKITMHHIKHLRNHGKTSMKNCIAICEACHKRFNRFKGDLVFEGMTYRLHKIEEVNMKLVVQEGKLIRKANKEFHGVIVSWEWLCILLEFLNIDYREINYNDRKRTSQGITQENI